MLAPHKSTKKFFERVGGSVRSTGLVTSIQRALVSLEVSSPHLTPLRFPCPSLGCCKRQGCANLGSLGLVWLVAYRASDAWSSPPCDHLPSRWEARSE